MQDQDKKPDEFDYLPEIEYPISTRPPGRQPTAAMTVIEETIRKTGGITGAIAKQLNVAPSTVSNWFRKYPHLRKIREEAIEHVLDIAEGQLFKHIQEGNLTAIIFTLKTKGKERGYSERQEITGPNGGPVISATYSEWTDIPIDERLAALRDLRKQSPDETSGGGGGP
jgi:transcriptional regulator with XRE-family HTH domain